MEEHVYQAISTLGFPMFVAVWLLIKQSRETKAMTEALIQLKMCIVELRKSLKTERD